MGWWENAPHPDLLAGQVQELVLWILENNSDPNNDYLAGVKGAIKTKKIATDNEKGILVMTAIYRDHGSNDEGQNSIQAQNTLILKNHWLLNDTNTEVYPQAMAGCWITIKKLAACGNIKVLCQAP